MDCWIKKQGPDGKTSATLVHTVQDAVENYKQFRDRGYKVWIEDTNGKVVSPSIFGIDAA